MGGGCTPWCMDSIEARDIGKRRTAFAHAGSPGAGWLRNARGGWPVRGPGPQAWPWAERRAGCPGLGTAQQPQVPSLAAWRACMRCASVQSGSATGIGNHKIHAPCGGDLLREPVASCLLLVGTRFAAAHDEHMPPGRSGGAPAPSDSGVELRCIGCGWSMQAASSPGPAARGPFRGRATILLFDGCLRLTSKRESPGISIKSAVQHCC